MKNLDLSRLKKKKLFILDMDGTFYLGDRLIPGSLEFLEKLKRNGQGYLFYTNNSSKTGDIYHTKLTALGCDRGNIVVYTSGDVTIHYLKENYPGRKVYLLGTESLKKSFREAEIELVENQPDLVVAGFDTTFTYEKINKACSFIRKGALFLATHPDLNCPVEDGFLPDCGSLCAMITASTGVKPRGLGKPYSESLEYILKKTGCRREDMVIVGDRLYTDILFGLNNGITSILVLSGETNLEMVENSGIKPDYIFASLGELSHSCL